MGILKKFLGIAAAGVLSLSMLLPIQAVYADGTSTDYTYSADASDSKKSWTKIADNTWTMDLDGDGSSDVELTSSTDGNGNDVWTYTFYVEDDTKQYYVYEKMLGLSDSTLSLADGYTAKGSDSKTGVAADPGVVDSKTHTYTITNSKNHTVVPEKTGSLKITKNVTGTMSNPDQEFTFNITLSSDDAAVQKKLSGSKIFGSVPFISSDDGKTSVGTAAVKNGGTVEISGIPEGAKYSITENSVDGYETSSKTNDTGTISSSSPAESVWTNKSDYTPTADTVDVTLSKKVSGSSAAADPDASYSFTASFTGLSADTKYTYTIGSTSDSFVSDSDGSALCILSLKADGSAVFSSLPVGSSYQFLESGGAYIPSYTVSDSASLSKIKKEEDTGTKETELATAKETADKGENVTVTYTNTYPSSQNLIIRKEMSKNVDGKDTVYSSDQKFDFTIELFNIPEGTVMDSNIGKIVPDEYGEAVKNVKVPATGADGGIEIKDIPAGVEYKITEAGNSFKPSYVITSTDTNGKTITGTHALTQAEGTPGTDLSTGTKDSNGKTVNETIKDNQTDIVTFTNKSEVNFAIIKYNGTGSDASVLSGAQYTLYKYDGTALNTVSAKTTDTNGFAGWDALNPGIYALSETKAPDGYDTQKDIVFKIDDDSTITYTETSDKTATASLMNSGTLKGQTWEALKQYEDSNSGLTYTAFKVTDKKTHTPLIIPTGINGSTVLIAMGIISGVMAAVGIAVIIRTKSRAGRS